MSAFSHLKRAPWIAATWGLTACAGILGLQSSTDIAFADGGDEPTTEATADAAPEATAETTVEEANTCDRAESADDAGAAIGDPGYEQQPDGGSLASPWYSEGPDSGVTIRVDHSGDGHSGMNCGYIYDTGSGSWSAILQTIPVTPNTNYTLSAWLQTTAADDGGDPAFTATGELGVRTTSGELVGEHEYGEMADYEEVSVSFASGPECSVVIFAGFTSTAGQVTWIHVDDWSLVAQLSD